MLGGCRDKIDAIVNAILGSPSTPTPTLTATPTLTPTLVPTATLTPTPAPFDDQFGEGVAARAQELAQNSSNRIPEGVDFWDMSIDERLAYLQEHPLNPNDQYAVNPDETGSITTQNGIVTILCPGEYYPGGRCDGHGYVPYGEEFNHVTHYVCVDVVRDAFTSAGFDLQQAILTSSNEDVEAAVDGVRASHPTYSEEIQDDMAARSAPLLHTYIENTSEIQQGTGGAYRTGEVVFVTEGNTIWHTGVVVQGGNSPDDIRVVHASYSRLGIVEESLADLESRARDQGRTIEHGIVSQDEVDRMLGQP